MHHPNHGQVATPRLRPSPAPTNPASRGAGGRRTPSNLQAELQAQRRKMVRAIDLLLAILDGMDGDADREPEPCECSGDPEMTLQVPA